MKTKKAPSAKEKSIAQGKNKPGAKIAKPVIAQNGEAQPTPRRK
ncbi:MAG: hypothetical protein JWN25_1012 [Verrucomicrobiales bacterium]|nr:hypothetical protein [Verrucomicrobiales bacterium]